MLVSDSKKFIFIHIQKTGGTSLRNVLKGTIPDLEEGRGGKYHVPLSDILKSYPRLRCDDYYTVAFIRNPWDRLVSWYSDISRNTKILPYGTSCPYNMLRQSVVRRARSFEDFILFCHDILGRAGRLPFSLNQIDYLMDMSGNFAADFIGRFENYQESAAALFRTLGLPTPAGGGLPVTGRRT